MRLWFLGLAYLLCLLTRTSWAEKLTSPLLFHLYSYTIRCKLPHLFLQSWAGWSCTERFWCTCISSSALPKKSIHSKDLRSEGANRFSVVYKPGIILLLLIAERSDHTLPHAMERTKARTPENVSGANKRGLVILVCRADDVRKKQLVLIRQLTPRK